jgi:filamentous hemagglutinin family protein
MNLRPIALLFLMGCAIHAAANPTGGVVAAGTATMTTAGNVLTITSSNGAIINWTGFSIGSGETTRFVQSSASATVLNRVTGTGQSSILGALTSNGHVFLINPNGMVFAPGAQVNVAALTLSTTGITDANFLVGNYAFVSGPGGDITIAGAIQANTITVNTGSGSVSLAGTLTTTGTLTTVGAGAMVLAATNTGGSVTTTVSTGNFTTLGGGSIGSQTGVVSAANSGQGSTTNVVSLQGTTGVASAAANPAAVGGQSSVTRDASIGGGTSGGLAAANSLSFNLQKRAASF